MAIQRPDYQAEINKQDSLSAIGFGGSVLTGALSIGIAATMGNPLMLLAVFGVGVGAIFGQSTANSEGLKQQARMDRDHEIALSKKDDEIFFLKQEVQEYRAECQKLGQRLKGYEGELNTQIVKYAALVAERNESVRQSGIDSEQSRSAIAKSEAECLRLEAMVERMKGGTKARQVRAFRVVKRKIGQAVEAAIAEREAELRGESVAVLDEMERQCNAQILDAQKVIDKLNFNIDLLERKVTFWEAQAQMHAEASGRADYFTGKTPQEIRGNVIIQQLKGCEVDVFKPEVKGVIGGFEYRFDYRGAFEDAALKSAKVLIQRDLGDELPPEISVADHKVRVILWHSKESKPVRDLLRGISDYSWMPSWFADGVHFQVMAETGSGKSTFLNNFLGWIEQQNLGSDFTISDTKGDPEAWNGRKVHHVGVSGTARHFSRFKDLMDSRLATHRRETMEGMPPTIYGPHFGVFDEYELYLNESAQDDEEAAQVESKAFRSVLIAGRSPKTRMIFVSQSPNCSRLGLQNADLNNVARIVVGAKTLKYLIQARGKEIFGNQLDEVQKQFDLWRARAKKSDDPKFKHYGVIDLDGDWTFVLLPPPSHFAATGQTAATPVAAPVNLSPPLEQAVLGVCPDCRTPGTRWKNRGKSVKCENSQCSRGSFALSKSLPIDGAIAA